MDLNSIGKTLATNVSKMHLKAPDGDPLYAFRTGEVWDMTTVCTPIEGREYFPCLIHCVGRDSPAFRSRQAKVTAETLKLLQTKKLHTRDAEESEREDMQTVAVGIVGWENIVWSDDSGRPYLIEHSTENVVKVLQGYRPAFEQANEHIGDRANFFRIA